MPFDQSVITSVAPPVYRGGAMVLEWTSSTPTATFQVYAGSVLAWAGKGLHAAIPAPRGRTRIEIGAVADSELHSDFSASLTAPPADHVTLTWLGGTYLDPTGNGDVQGFRVYGEPTAGAGIDYGKPLATISLTSGGTPPDGFGLGGFGQGGFGQAAGSYTWTSGSLDSGTWHFAVRAYDSAGNESTAATGAQTIAVPPRPPAPQYPGGPRLECTWDAQAREATLSWLPSPSPY